MKNETLHTINSFVSLDNDQLITLTVGQLKDLFFQALQPLQDRVSALEDSYTRLQEENAALKATQDHLSENQEIQLHLINELKEAARKKPQPTQKDRAEILRALLAANGGKMLAKDARQKMHLPKNRFSELLDNCAFLECKPLHSDRRKMIIILKSELVPRN